MKSSSTYLILIDNDTEIKITVTNNCTSKEISSGNGNLHRKIGLLTSDRIINFCIMYKNLCDDLVLRFVGLRIIWAKSESAFPFEKHAGRRFRSNRLDCNHIDGGKIMKKLFTAALVGIMAVGMAVPSFAAPSTVALPGTDDYLLARAEVDSRDVGGTGKTQYGTELYNMSVNVAIQPANSNAYISKASDSETNVSSMTIWASYTRNSDRAYRVRVVARPSSKNSHTYTAEKTAGLSK